MFFKYIVEEEKDAALKQKVRDLERELRKTMRPPKRYDEIDRVWLPQYQRVLHRYRFLVLGGHSMAGKTCWAKRLTQPGRALEISCARASHAIMK